MKLLWITLDCGNGFRANQDAHAATTTTTVTTASREPAKCASKPSPMAAA